MTGAKRNRWIWGAVAAAAAAVLLFVFWPRAPKAASQAPGEALLAASQGLDDIAITADFDPTYRRMTVSQTLRLVNRTGTAQQSLVLRTYANAFRDEAYSPAATDELHDACYPDGFSAGGLTFQSVKQVRGDASESLSYAYDDDAHTVLRLTLPERWEAGAELTVRLDYTLAIPQAAYRFGESGGLWALGNCFAIPSPWLDGHYLTDAYTSIGDPFVSECRNYTVALTVPSDYRVAGSAEAQAAGDTADGRTVYRLEALAARDFALALSRDYQPAEDMQGSTLVRACATTGEKAALLLRYAKKALACYGQRYGAYPYPCFTLAETDYPLGGMSYPALAMIGSSSLAQGGDSLEQLVARETAHQWWYAVVGNDSFRQAWQDEALCEFSLLDEWEASYGRSAREDLQFSRVETAMRVTIPEGVTPGSPVDYFGDVGEYTLVVSRRGAAALCALDTALDGRLDEFLAAYYHTYAFQLASRENFEDLLRSFSGGDWSPLLSDYLDTYLNN